MSNKEHDKENVSYPLGEVMPGLDQMPGEIYIDSIPSLSRLEEKGQEFRRKSPDIMEAAKKKGQDVVIFTSARGTSILVGAGIAAAATLAILGGIKIYQHRHKK